jgi:hypothetical protein
MIRSMKYQHSCNLEILGMDPLMMMSKEDQSLYPRSEEDRECLCARIVVDVEDDPKLSSPIHDKKYMDSQL